MTDEKKKNEHKTDKHHGQAGDGNDLIPIKADGTPAKYDKYGNLVTENTGKGKGIMLKQSYQTASKNIAAPSPAEIAYGLTRPYWSINTMPIEYVYNSVIRYFNSIIEPKYERIPVVDEEGEPLLDDDGKTILHTVLTSYIYKNTPTKYGLAQALGVELSTLNNYLRAETVHADSNIDYTGMNSKNKGYRADNMNTYVNRDNKLVNITDIDENSVLYQLYGEDILYDDRVRELISRKTEKDIKLFIIKRAMTEVMKFHEQRLGVNENVTGSMFALLNSRDGWTNDHTVKVEFPDLLGKPKTVEELDRMTELEEEPIVLSEKDGEFTVKDIDLDED